MIQATCLILNIAIFKSGFFDSLPVKNKIEARWLEFC